METCQLKCIPTLTSYIFNKGNSNTDPTFGFKLLYTNNKLLQLNKTWLYIMRCAPTPLKT